MQNPGRGRRLAAGFVLALVCAALAPAAANADTVTFAGGTGPEYDGFVNIFPNTAEAQKVGVTISYSGAEHLVPGTQVQLSPGPLDPGFAAGNLTITVPNDWGLGKTARVDATVTYTSGPLLQITEAHFLTWNPTSYSCTLGGTSCLTVSGSRRIDTRTDPHPVTNVDSDAGVVDADVTWDHSAEHDQLTQYFVIRLQFNAANQQVGGQAFTVSPNNNSFHDQGLLPGTRYCWRVRGQKVVPIGEFGGNQVIPTPLPDPEVCKTTGTNPPAPASGPSGPALDGDGQFDLSWEPSAEPGVTYDIEHRDANDATWSPLASGLTAPSYAAGEAEGTWQYHVRARNAQRGLSDWVVGDAPVKVDKTAPSAPTATSTGESDGDWFKDTVSVAFGDSTDPPLADGSDPSGVASYAGNATFDTSGTHAATGAATDNAGHTSEETTKTVQVDAAAPEITVSGCPTRRVLLDSEVRLHYSASDADSGLAEPTPATGDVLLDTSTVGPHSRTITARDNVDHSTNSETCAYTVYENSPPPTPAAPSGPSLDADGVLKVTWDAVTDPDEEDSLEYAVQRQDADDTEWTDVPDRVSAAELAASLDQGTWKFRVKAIDNHGAASEWSDASNAIKVDKSAPSAPTATTDPTQADYDGWFKDQVEVAFGGSEDPTLPDTSLGSGVVSYAGAATFAASGTHTATGTATDAAGHTSAATDKSVKVDATDPTATITCPSGALIVGQPDTTASWHAEDAHSGINGASDGTVALDTSTPGTKTASAPAPVDNVGHTGEVKSCPYTVAYKFTGFLSPINGDAVNVGKTGRTYPVKWRLQRYDGSLISDTEAQALVPAMLAGQRQTDCAFGLAETATLDDAATGDTELRYDAAADQFIYNYKAPQTLACYVLGIRNADGANTRQVNFRFTR